MTNYLNLNSLTAGAPYQTERKLIWIYLWLLIFEGALRKWVLPGLATPLLLIREPIVIYLVINALFQGWIKSGFAKTMMIVSSISLIFSLVAGHHDLFVGFFGWRIYFFHFPMIFVMGKVLTRDDLLKMARFILYLSVPMTVLVVMQFYSPQSAWVNRGLGGDMEGAGFSGALGYFRPPGTFSFIAGYATFQGLVCSLLCFYIVANKLLPIQYRFSNLWMGIIIGCYFVSVPTSISRTVFYQTLLLLAFLLFAALRNNRLKGKFVKFAIIAAVVIVVVLSSGVANTQIEAFGARFEAASEAEGGVQGTIGNRYMGSWARGLFQFDVPVFGYGIGIGTNVGSKLLGGNMYSFGFNGEEEWGRVVGECGILIGWIIILVRVLFTFDILKRAYRALVRINDLLPWMLAGIALTWIPNGQWGVPTSLGFVVMACGMALAAINHPQVKR